MLSYWTLAFAVRSGANAAVPSATHERCVLNVVKPERTLGEVLACRRNRRAASHLCDDVERLLYEPVGVLQGKLAC